MYFVIFFCPQLLSHPGFDQFMNLLNTGPSWPSFPPWSKTNCLERSPLSLKKNTFYGTRRIITVGSIWSQMDPVHMPSPFYLANIHIITTLHEYLRASFLRISLKRKTCMQPSSSHACYMLGSSHLPKHLGEV
jgi:hypothetical protein